MYLLNQKFKVDITKDLEVKVNGEVVSDPRLKPYKSSLLSVKQISSNYIGVNGFGFKLFFQRRGTLEIKLEPFYEGMVSAFWKEKFVVVFW